MKRRKKKKQRIRFTALLLILSLTQTSCGAHRQTEKTETSLEVGLLNERYFYEKDGIVVSSDERFLYSDWDPVEFDYICTDPTCAHLSENCSARTFSEYKGIAGDFSLIYEDRLIILHGYVKGTFNRLSETETEWINAYQTDVYEADPDGSRRQKKATFSGAIGYLGDTHAAVLVDGKLYFGGPTEERIYTELDALGYAVALEDWISDAVYCLDLSDYTMETFAAVEDKDGIQQAYQYQFYWYDGLIYAAISSFMGDNAVWYRIDPKTNLCEEILCFDSGVARFWGAIGDTVYYWYENSPITLYARELAAGGAEREFITVPEENKMAIPFIVDGQILCLTDYRMEGAESMSEYTVLDPEGKVLDTIRYDAYLTFLDVVGDKIIYYKMESDSDWKAWWVDKKDLKNLLKKGTQIGPLNGSKLDTLED